MLGKQHMLVDMPLVYICWLVLEYGDEYLANELLASELSNIGNVRAEDLGNKIRPLSSSWKYAYIIGT
jgi:hypothetical protein